MNEKDCDPNPTKELPNGNCGNAGLATFFIVSYLVISFLIVMNMFIAVILENFSQATEDVQQGLTQDDFDMYYEIWEKFDEEATQYIPYTRLHEFVDTLEEPLRIPLPNHFKLVQLNIPICEDEQIHCVDILDALTKNFLGTVDDGEMGEVKTATDRPNYKPTSSMLKRQREMVCARIIQRTWQNFVARKKAQRETHIIVDIVEEEEDNEPVELKAQSSAVA